MIESIDICGYRGFADKQTLKLAIPDGETPGSGLTVLVGPNNGGKTTVVEAFRPFAKGSEYSFSVGARNKKAGDQVRISMNYKEQPTVTLQTIPSGGATAKFNSGSHQSKIYFLPSRRIFSPYFSKNRTGRDGYSQNRVNSKFRTGDRDDTFSGRLFNANESGKKDEFNELFAKVAGKSIDWTIDQDDRGSYYIKVNKSDGSYHTSEGLGEGIISLLFLVDALFESNNDELLVFDEPELSLHPQYQRRLLKQILEYSKTRQIVYATHSPELVSIEAILNGGELARIVSSANGTKIHQLSEEGRGALRKLSGDLHNPHVLGYDARSCFFEEDNLVIVEGQEDVIFLNIALDELNIDQDIRFFGYGAGGAEKITYIATILKSLGYQNICALFDGDKDNEAENFKIAFPNYKCEILPADDIRDKKGKTTKSKNGVFKEGKKIKDEFKEPLKEILQRFSETVTP